MTEEYKKRPGPQNYTYKGRPVSLKELAEMAEVSTSTMSRRLNKKKWTPEKAVDDPYGVWTGKEKEKEEQKQKIIKYNGIEDTVAGWARRLNISFEKLYARLNYPPIWSYDEALGGALRLRPNAATLTVITPTGPVTKTRKDWAKERKIPAATIAKRQSRGWTDAQALDFDPPPVSAAEKTGKYKRTPEENEARRRRHAEKRKQQQKED